VGAGASSELGAILIDTAVNVTADSTINAASLVQTTGTGTTTLSGDVTTSAIAGVNLTNAAIVLDGLNILTTNGGIVRLNGPTNLITAATDIDAAGTITFTGALTSTGAQNLTLESDANIDFDSTVGAGASSELGAILIDTAVNVTADSTINAASLVQTTGTGTTTLSGAVNTSAVAGVNIVNQTIAVNNGITTTGDGIVTLNADTATLTIGSTGDINSTGAVNLTGATGISTAGDVTTTNDNITYHSAVTLTGAVALASGTGIISLDSTVDNGGFLLTIDNNTGASDSTITGIMSGAGGLTKEGTGVLALNGVNTYTGVTTINGGTVKIGADSGLGTAPGVATAGHLVFNGGTLQTTADTTLNINRGIALTGNGTFSTDASTTLTSGGIIAGAGNLTKIGAGTLALSGANTYSGGTTITTGTLQASHISALGTGFVTNNATLDVGTTDVAGVGVYTQGANATFKVTADSATTSGSLSSTAAAIISTATTSVVDMTVATNLYIPTSATFNIIDTGGLGASGVPGTINTLLNRHVKFTGSTATNNLVLTADRSANGFASDAADSNGKNVGQILDNITSPTADMTTVLNELEGLTSSETSAALNTMLPEIDSGILDNNRAALNNFVGASLGRVQSVLTNAAAVAAGKTGVTGVSSGDENKLNGIWAKGYGSYLDQGTRSGIQGYTAWNAGTAVGVDRLFGDVFTLGVSGGYALGKVNAASNNADTDITSGQGTVYAGYQDPNIPYFIDAAGSFAWNWYEGSRDISVGGIGKTAKADYDGQQYGLYLGGGYKFKLRNNIELTPLASIQWNHLSLSGYTETGADAMNLTVNDQSYDIFESGLGASLSAPLKYKWGNFTPEVHVRWLYDFIGDAMAVTSTFSGGGGSFSTNGAKPAKSGVNLGGKLAFDLKNDISVVAECDTEMRSEFFGVFGSASLRYEF
ncbi:MAG: autotransporter domain-containing protein, partial [Candidatus Paceibacterota bacterium]